MPSPTDLKGIDLPPVSEDLQVTLLVQLWADFFKHLSTLGVAASAGLLILLEIGVLERDGAFFGSLALFACGSLLALFGVLMTVGLVENRGGSTKPLKHLVSLTMFLMGMGAGILFVLLAIPRSG